jgi:hypothetical protein
MATECILETKIGNERLGTYYTDTFTKGTAGGKTE